VADGIRYDSNRVRDGLDNPRPFRFLSVLGADLVRPTGFLLAGRQRAAERFREREAFWYMQKMKQIGFIERQLKTSKESCSSDDGNLASNGIAVRLNSK